jgi:hypothetical protein
MTDPVRAEVAVEVVLAGDRRGVAEVLDDLERVPKRQHLRVRHRLDVIGQLLELAVVLDRRRERVLVDVVGVLHDRAGVPDPRQHLTSAPADVVDELQITRRRRLGQVDADDVLAGWLAIQRVAGRVRTPVLHRLQHRGHVAPDTVRAVAVLVDDPRDPAHGYGSTSRYSSRSQSVTAARYRSHSSRL